MVSQRTEELEQEKALLTAEIARREQAEAETRKALAKERELGELKSRFITMTSHEFRTPMSILLTSAQIDLRDGAAAPRTVEAALLSVVLAYWLERAGTPVLHASAVAWADGAVAFLSDSGCGKSALAAAMIRCGALLVTDDILPLISGDDAWWALPAFPAMRMWPDEAEFFLGGYEALSHVHPDSAKRYVPVGAGGFGAFNVDPVPLRCLYLPERRAADTGDEIDRSQGRGQGCQTQHLIKSYGKAVRQVAQRVRTCRLGLHELRVSFEREGNDELRCARQDERSHEHHHQVGKQQLPEETLAQQRGQFHAGSSSKR